MLAYAVLRHVAEHADEAVMRAAVDRVQDCDQHVRAAAGTQCTSFTGTTVRILTQKALLVAVLRKLVPTDHEGTLEALALRLEFPDPAVRSAAIEPGSLDWVIMNPPFHDGGTEDKQLGQAFIRRAADVLRHPRHVLGDVFGRPGWSHDGSRETSDTIRARWLEAQEAKAD